MTDNSDRDVLRAALSREAVIPFARRGLSPARRVAIVARQAWFCACTGCEARLVDGRTRIILMPFEIDHIIPLELGGADDDSNLQALCVVHHKEKSREDLHKIRKAARLRRDADPETRRRSPHKIRSRGFQKADELK